MGFRIKERRLKDTYFELVRDFPLVAIRNDRHLHRAHRMIDSLLREGRLDSGEEAYLEVLSHLVEDYEDKHHTIPAASDADLLRHLIEAKEVSQAEVARETGIARSTISEVLSGKRQISKAMIGKLAKYFHVEPGVFVGDR